MMVARETAMRADGLHFFGESVRVGEQGATISVTAERFGWEKAGAANRGQATTAATALRRAEALGAIFNHGQAMAIGNGIDAIVIRHLAEQTHRQDGFSPRSYGGFEQININIKTHRIDVHEYRGGSHQPDYFAGADPGERH